ncbi:hypothetical protein GGR57DRAFT_149977 [Xylariaceae sp. FL1272]|nr:hypothetical protein GGR57DRAFT_149977 [Xylariaceae sp. FL1272]
MNKLWQKKPDVNGHGYPNGHHTNGHMNGHANGYTNGNAVEPANDVAHENMIKYISELIVCDIQGNMSSEFLRQVHACKKSGLAPHEKAERMRVVRDMRKTLERLTEEMGQKFYEEYRIRPKVGRWYDSWLLNEPPQFLRWEQEWGFTPDEGLLTIDGHSMAGSMDGSIYGARAKVAYKETHTRHVDERFIDIPEVDDIPEEDDNMTETNGHYEPTLPAYNANAPVTEKTNIAPVSSTGRCDCGIDRDQLDEEHTPVKSCRDVCICAVQGCGCIATCRCDETCSNPFNSLAFDHILGTDATTGAPQKPSPCFISFALKHDSASTLTLDYLFEHLLGGLDVVPEGACEAIDAWRVKWETSISGDDAEKQTEELERDLLRIGLGVGHGECFFSFCHPNHGRVGSWQQDALMWHCQDCANCNERREWHCKNCNNCTFGLAVPCGGCGGVSSSYHTEPRE